MQLFLFIRAYYFLNPCLHLRKMDKKKRGYDYISEEKRIAIIQAAQSRHESIKACASRLGVKYITAKQIVKRWREKGIVMTKGCKKDDNSEKGLEESPTAKEEAKEEQKLEQICMNQEVVHPIIEPTMVNHLPYQTVMMNSPFVGYGGFPQAQLVPFNQFQGYNQMQGPQFNDMGATQNMLIPCSIVPVAVPGYVYFPPQAPLNQVSSTLNNPNSPPQSMPTPPEHKEGKEEDPKRT